MPKADGDVQHTEDEHRMVVAVFHQVVIGQPVGQAQEGDVHQQADQEVDVHDAHGLTPQ